MLGAGGGNKLTHDLAFVAAEIVHDDDISGPKGGQQDLLDIGPEARPGDRPLDEPWCIDPVMAQGRQERWRGAFARVAPTPAREPYRSGPGLVDEDQSLSFDATLILCPLGAPTRHVGTIAFASDQAFFLKLSFSACTKSRTDW
jgi:hypothetical protein